MFALTLEINQKCNLGCKYCYLGEKEGSMMDIQTAKNAVEYGIKNALMHEDRSLYLDFIGGEALIDFAFMVKVVEYINSRVASEMVLVRYSLTTNVILLSEEIVDFLVKHDFDLKVSIDGSKECHDRNRVMVNGKGSFDLVISKFHLVKEYEQKSGKITQVTNVVTKNNFKDYYDSVEFLVNTMKFRFIDSAIDIYPDWLEYEQDIIKKEVDKIFALFIRKYAEGNGFHWQLIIDAESLLCNKEKFYSCGGGIVSIYVRTDGDIYPCPTCFDASLLLGNVNSGLNKPAINKLMMFTDIDNKTCHTCEIYDKCGANSCIAASISKNENKNKPNPMLCWINKLQYELYNNKKKILLDTFK